MWKVIFTGAVCLVLALACGLLGVALYRETPWASVTFAAVDAGIVFGGLKTVLDTTKTANELRKMTLDIRKLEMEIEEKRQAAEKADTQVVVATLEEIKQYATPTLRRTTSSTTRIATIVTTIVMVVAVGVTLPFMNKSPLDTKSAPPSLPEQPLPSTPEPGRGGENHGRRDKVAEDFYELAFDLAKKGEYCEALTFIDKAIQKVPSNAKYLRLQRMLKDGCSAK